MRKECRRGTGEQREGEEEKSEEKRPEVKAKVGLAAGGTFITVSNCFLSVHLAPLISGKWCKP